MKKYIYTLLAAIAMLTSCTNDDIDIKYEKDEHFYQTFTYNVSTQDAYDKFGITNDLINRSLNETSYIAVYTFIYDRIGNIVTSDSVYSKTFGAAKQQFTLENGQYTAVTIEMIVDEDLQKQHPTFYLTGKDKLSTLEIAYKKAGIAFWYDAIATCSTVIDVTQQTNSINITPEPKGALLTAYYSNFDKSSYEYLIMCTKNAPLGRYLDPSLNGASRFHYDSYLGKNTWTLRGFAINSESSPKESLYSPWIYILEEGTIISCLSATSDVEAWYAYPSDNMIWTFNDGRQCYAGLFYKGGTSGNDCTGDFFNTKNEYNTWYNSVKDSYKPDAQPLSLMTPNTKWKSTVSSVQSSMSGYTMVFGSNGKAEQLASGSYAIAYNGKGSENLIAYYFDTMTTGLNEADVYYAKSTTKQADIKSALDKKYTFIAESDGMYMYANSAFDTIILLMDTTDDYVVGYVDADVLQNSPSYKTYAQNKAKKIKSSPVKPMMKSQCSSKIMIPFKPAKVMNRMNIMK